ncbi:MAG: histidinol-phosphate transaminase [Christensenella sp.]
MKEYWSEKAKKLSPYTAGEQPKEKLIKLNTNENAYPQSPDVAQAVAQAVQNLRLYPDPNTEALAEEIARYHNVKPSEVFCANGSDEALAMCFAAFFAGNDTANSGGWFPSTQSGHGIKTLDVTYSFYPVWANFFDVPLEIIPLHDDYSVNIQRMCNSGGVILANPNAPTGINIPLMDIMEIIEKTKGVAVIDEAYAAFSGSSAIPLVSTYKNLAVVRTLSKSHSLAGLRVGYVIAQENLINALKTVKDSFNSYTVDALAQAGAIAALRDEAYYEETTRKIVDTRVYTVGELWKMGITCLPSSANFIFARMDTRPAKSVMAALREKGILVRWFDGERTQDFLRITIGTREDMDAFLTAMRELQI